MNCDHVELQLADYATDRLAAPDSRRITEHLEACPRCREFQDQIRRLYALDLDEALPSPLERGPVPMLRLPASRRPAFARPLLRAAAAAAILLAIWAVWRPATPGPYGPTPGDPAAGAPLAVESIVLQVPEAAPDWVEGEWLGDLAVARRLAAYSGRPLLREYYYVQCPRCQDMAPRFRSQSFRDEASEFVWFQTAVELGEEPEEIARIPTDKPKMLMFPVVIVGDEERSLAPVFEIDSIETVVDLIVAWDDSTADRERPLDRAAYERCRQGLADFVSHLGRSEFAGAVDALDEVLRLGSGRRTRFVPEALELREALLASIDAIVDRLSASWKSDPAARTKAKALRMVVEGLPAAARLDALLAG